MAIHCPAADAECLKQMRDSTRNRPTQLPNAAKWIVSELQTTHPETQAGTLTARRYTTVRRILAEACSQFSLI
jgi:hypothetical protein